jgi:hypothetical protein
MARRRIFISYRRADAAGYAGRLEADLTRLLGDCVFMDVSDIAPGTEFPKALDAELRTCGAVLVVIGPRWRPAFDERPADEDYVRLEVRQALAHDGVAVVPLLVHGATLPARDDLPDGLGALADRQAVSLRDDRWDDDVSHLAGQLRTTLGIRRAPLRLLAVAGIALAVAGYWLLPIRDRTTAHGPTTSPSLRRARRPPPAEGAREQRATARSRSTSSRTAPRATSGTMPAGAASRARPLATACCSGSSASASLPSMTWTPWRSASTCEWTGTARSPSTSDAPDADRGTSLARVVRRLPDQCGEATRWLGG